MTNPLAISIIGTPRPKSQYASLLVQRLQALFDIVPDEELLESLKIYYAGRNGYTYKVLWRTYMAMVVLNLPSFAALIRYLESNPYVAQVCGIENYDSIPSKFAYSRFMKKLQELHNVVLVKGIMRYLTEQCYRKLPNFGKSVAIDSTDLKAWSNGSKTVKADPDAGWVIKSATDDKKKFVWGYKLHLMVDTTYEIPVMAAITKGNTADISYASHLLRQARYLGIKFRPDYVICDAGYSGGELRHLIKRQYRAEAVIKAHKTHKKWLGDETDEWKLIFNRRTAVERVFGRMKTQRRLNHVTVRRKRKVTVHSLVPVIVTQAMALAFPHAPRSCVA